MPKGLQRIVFIAGSIVSIAFLLILTYQTFLDAVNSTAKNETIMGSVFVVIWPSKWALPIGFTAITIVMLLHIRSALKNPENFNPNPASPDLNDPLEYTGKDRKQDKG